jgi:two-component system, sensor histidine kinase and response regulator
MKYFKVPGRFWWIGLLLAWPLALWGQDQRQIDSLLQSLNHKPDDSVRVLTYLKLSRLHEVREPFKSTDFAEKAWNLSQQINHAYGKVESSYQLGTIYQCDLADYTTALHWYTQAMNAAIQHKNITYQGSISYNLGTLFLDQGDTMRAVRYLTEAVKIADKNKNYQTVAIANTLLGDYTKDKIARFAYYQKAVKAAEKDTSASYAVLDAWKRMGDYYRARNQQTEAAKWYEKIIQHQLSAVWEDFADIHIAQILAEAYFFTGNIDTSEVIVKRLMKVTQVDAHSSDFYTVEALRLLSEIFQARGQMDSAYLYLQECFDLSDSLKETQTRNSAQQQIFNIQNHLEYKEREKALLALRSQSDMQQIYATFLLIGIILSGLFTYYMYRMRQREYRQNERLAGLNRTKDKILSILSHDIRSPLNALQNILHLFDAQLATPADVRTVTNQVRASIHNLYQNLDNLLLWAQSQQEDLTANPEQVNIHDLVEEQVDLLADWAEQKQVRLETQVPDDLYAFADPIHARLAIQNLLTNAMKFVPELGMIQINAQRTFEHGIQVEIIDNGTGIPEEAVEKIFDPAIRYTRPGTAGEPGSGLGLSLTRELMELNQGAVLLESTLGTGTKATLRFLPFVSQI